MHPIPQEELQTPARAMLFSASRALRERRVLAARSPATARLHPGLEHIADRKQFPENSLDAVLADKRSPRSRSCQAALAVVHGGVVNL